MCLKPVSISHFYQIVTGHTKRIINISAILLIFPPIPNHVRLRPERILQKILIFFRLDKIRKHAYDKDNLNK